MKLLILGGKGMAGHMLTSYFRSKKEYEVIYTSRDKHDQEGLFLDVTNAHHVEEVIESVKPDIVINCIGILNDFAEKNPLLALKINSILPNELAKLCDRYNGKLVHISTDCVFLGTKGDYTENDIPDGTTMYAQSKKWGEIISDNHLTIRTSIIGPELKDDGIGLFLWFMKQKGTINGFDKVFWNGVTTLELAKATEDMIKHNVTGLYHLGSETKISKYELLKLIQKVFNKEDVTISKDEQVVLDRTIKSTRTDYHFTIPSYERMLTDLRDWMKEND
ncbi:SDR family oxidoreductase [Metabacillus malikii]|uniref:dTDP-4-dehydrorhamnose reductase n=1 Tax=Metabacillus malikii TaxID=1504265 RepID=A0ABT9ZJN6_9BACI|nr:SDR family oxidoreductase [Metabacillus malikii]MDQ0232510.1 dTDP-4-dehydrorhamnose reductase [Metabacillus malikii]